MDELTHPLQDIQKQCILLRLAAVMAKYPCQIGLFVVKGVANDNRERNDQITTH